MGLFDIFKRKNFRCDISEKPMNQGEGYLLTTSQVVVSRKYWDYFFSKPDLRQINRAHFINKDVKATQARGAMVIELFQNPHPWLISEEFIHLFDIDKTKAKESVNKFWEANGKYYPPLSGPAKKILNEKEITEASTYAIAFAGSKSL